MARALPPGLVAGLVRVPELAAVVAELGVASLAPAAQLGALGAAVRYHRVAVDGRGDSIGGLKGAVDNVQPAYFVVEWSETQTGSVMSSHETFVGRVIHSFCNM